MQEHLRRIKNKEIFRHYLGKIILNEIVSVYNKAIKTVILTMVKKALYYASIVDCTPDDAHVEQMTIIVRFVDFDTTQVSYIKIHEHFLGFFEMNDTKGN